MQSWYLCSSMISTSTDILASEHAQMPKYFFLVYVRTSPNNQKYETPFS